MENSPNLQASPISSSVSYLKKLDIPKKNRVPSIKRGRIYLLFYFVSISVHFVNVHLEGIALYIL
ncbi:hypothetical protein A6B38_04855 [Bartonella bacilliformis]|uniref:Uncharacterized protein n=1 Tax=Bartonella bacilliformis INS TaxID=1206782 RepID=A0ABP2SL24_BARBA|nr:hypothetical protein AL467_05335 [Bartonella bacilliformis]EKS43028.1 hypothetical protein BbINS_05307 [Bartonella bacilliformis INS]KZM37489.1 hypothetical protein AWH67_04940 [Bartonella bacilliformis]KZN21527.1 hypothetical protein A6B38_04855 [Bartonella bacilliformis]